MNKKRPVGRPRKAVSDSRTCRLEIRLLRTEQQAFKEAAAIAGVEVSAWARERLRRVAIRELEEANRPIPFVSIDWDAK